MVTQQSDGEPVNASSASSAKAPAATLALISFGWFVIAVAASYVLNPAYTLSDSMQGNYDLGAQPFLIASTFFSLGAGSLALAVGLRHAIPASRRSTVGLLLLGMWGAGIFVAGIFPAYEPGSTVGHTATVLIAGIFPVDVYATPETEFGFLHIFLILGSFVCLAVAAMLLSAVFERDERWRRFGRVSIILALAMLATVILFLPLALFPCLAAYAIFRPGLLIILTGVEIGIVWLLLTAAYLRVAVIRVAPK